MRLAKYIGEAPGRVWIGDRLVAPDETVGPGGDVEAPSDIVTALRMADDFESIGDLDPGGGGDGGGGTNAEGRMFSIIPNPAYVEGMTETLLGSVYLPAGAALMRAKLGALFEEDSATLNLYGPEDDAPIASIAATGFLATSESDAFTLPGEGHYELRGLCNTEFGTAVFRGVEVDMR